MSIKRKPFHEYSQDQQKILADNYVRNMAMLKSEGIKYYDKGPVKIITTRTTKTSFSPHTGEWIMDINGARTTGRSGMELIKVLRTFE